MYLFGKELWLILIGLGLVWSCQTVSDTFEVQKVNLEMLNAPSFEGGQPHLLTTGKNTFLSWIEYLNDTTDALMCSRLDDGKWGEPVKISEGTDWFVNWADFPMVHAFGDDRSLAAHWLAKSDTGVYHYDVMVSISKDQGMTWASPMMLHIDSVKAEHGFVSMQAVGNEFMQAIWLDGRHTGAGQQGGSGAMTLRTATFDVAGNVSERVELDDRVCDCCQTSLAVTNTGPLAVYRDRSDKEIRDISFVQRIDGQWSTPKSVHPDNWLIAGCPVNGPQVISGSKSTVVTWFTQANNISKVKLSTMDSQGQSFKPPAQIDTGNPLGRVDLTWIDEESNSCFVVWLEQTGEEAEIRGRKVLAGTPTQTVYSLVEISPSRSSGFPSLIKAADGLILAWTHVDEVSLTTSIKTAIVDI